MVHPAFYSTRGAVVFPGRLSYYGVNITTYHLAPRLRMSATNAWLRSTDGLHTGRTTCTCFSPRFTYSHGTWQYLRTSIMAYDSYCGGSSRGLSCWGDERNVWPWQQAGLERRYFSSDFIEVYWRKSGCYWSQNRDLSCYNTIDSALAAKEHFCDKERLAWRVTSVLLITRKRNTHDRDQSHV